MAQTLSSERAVARARLAEYFRDRKTRAGVLARRLLGTAAQADAMLTEHLIRERRLQTRIDGSMDGGLVPTAWAAWELLQLEAPADQAGVVRTVGFLLGRQEQPGRVFGEGCRPYMHERRLCSHHVGGFFSAAPEEHPVAGRGGGRGGGGGGAGGAGGGGGGGGGGPGGGGAGGGGGRGAGRRPPPPPRRGAPRRR